MARLSLLKAMQCAVVAEGYSLLRACASMSLVPLGSIRGLMRRMPMEKSVCKWEALMPDSFRVASRERISSLYNT